MMRRVTLGASSYEDQCEGLIGDKVFQCSSSRIYGDFFYLIAFLPNRVFAIFLNGTIKGVDDKKRDSLIFCTSSQVYVVNEMIIAPASLAIARQSPLAHSRRLLQL